MLNPGCRGSLLPKFTIAGPPHSLAPRNQEHVRAMRFPDGSNITPRLAQLCTLIARGLCDKDIANEMNLTPGTVKVYISTRLLRAMRVDNRRGVTRWWMDNVERPAQCSRCPFRNTPAAEIAE